MLKACLVLIAVGLASPALAAIYKYVDAEGNVTFTDRYRPGAVKFVDSPPKGNDVLGAPAPRKRERASGPSPANFPKVDRQTQRRRDDVRRELLLEERRNEEQALRTVRTKLGDGKQGNAEELARMRESQRLHEKNIEMLDKELSRLK